MFDTACIAFASMLDTSQPFGVSSSVRVCLPNRTRGVMLVSIYFHVTSAQQSLFTPLQQFEAITFWGVGNNMGNNYLLIQ